MTRATLDIEGARYIDLVARTYPATATLLGIHDFDGELGSFTEPAMAQYAAELRSVRAAVDAIDPSELDAVARIDQAFLLSAIDSSLLETEGTQWWRRNPEHAIESALLGIYFLIEREFAAASERARSLEARLRRLPSFLLEARRTLADTPAILVEVAITSAESGTALVDMAMQWATEVGGGAGVVKEAAGPARDALREHAEWLRSEYKFRAIGATGVGEELLARVIATHHLLPESPDDIARRGEDLIQELNDAIGGVAGELGYRDWHDAVEATKNDVPAAGEVVSAYAEAMRWSESVVREHSLATLVEDAPLEVRETPVFWRHTLPYAAYSMPAPFESDQRGIFWVTPPDGDAEKLRGHARASIPVVALHEGFPGHHVQLTRANRHPSRVRRLADSSLFIEGWAFYCEEMAYEAGLLSTESRLCQLKDELWRACRIVIDMRLHQGRMTPAEAVDMLVRDAGLERPNAQAEVRRYAYSPGYQMAYAIGKQEILKLRQKVRAAEGENFSLARFHDRVLDEGSLPVPLISRALGV